MMAVTKPGSGGSFISDTALTVVFDCWMREGNEYGRWLLLEKELGLSVVRYWQMEIN